MEMGVASSTGTMDCILFHGLTLDAAKLASEKKERQKERKKKARLGLQVW